MAAVGREKKGAVPTREQMAYVQHGPSSGCCFCGEEVHATAENSSLSQTCWGCIINHSTR